MAASLVSAGLVAGGLLAAGTASAEDCVRGNIAIRYQQMGGEGSKLGRSVSCETPTSSGGAFTNFERGAIYWSPATGAWDVSGSFRDFWAATGWENGFLKYPTSTEVSIRSGGVFQNYQDGTMYWSPGSGPHSVSGSFRDLYAATGYENGFLGYPLSQETGIRSGGVYQNYQGGTMYWSPSSGAHTVSGDFRRLYGAVGFENGYLGYPTSQEIQIRGGVFQNYQGGTMYWSPQTGAHALQGSILDRYRQTGSENGVLGYPTSSEFDIPGGKRTNFQKGFIEWSAARGALVNQTIASSGPVVAGTIAVPGSANLDGLVLSVDAVNRVAPPSGYSSGYEAGDVPVAVRMTIRNTKAALWEPFDIISASSNGAPVEKVYTSGYQSSFDGPALGQNQSRTITVLFAVPQAVVGDFLVETIVYDVERDRSVTRFSTRL